MKINELFSKDIHRNIEGVITASKSSDEQVYQELDEYVVTRELSSHFSTFFEAYRKGIMGDTTKMGVWIQGFFGSGKSHFLKILSYILENKEINGKSAYDFFSEGDTQTRKIKDDITLANMQLAVNTPTNVILFNVESKHQAGIEQKNSLVNVFLKVFNDSLGYSTNPKVADLERRLDKVGLYEVFKNAFEEIHGLPWIEERHEVDFLQDSVVDALVEIGFMSKDAAINWFNTLETDYITSIEDFAILVEEYLTDKGNNQHIVFLVDEIGQYIGGNSDLTLQLQTIVEELGNKSHGKAWVIVTSQQAIDAITDMAGAAAHDFSKIKGRFETTLSLSSANADEVIQKRILAKNKSGQEYLEADFPNHESDIKSMFVFEESPELKIFSSGKNYADVYPFVPYQFNLLASILTQISKHSVQGSNLSRGERSLLAFFKETAERNSENESDVLVSLNQFYPSLEKWLSETDNAKVIKQAEENYKIVPDPNDRFNVEVLKVLFMIKYVDQNIKPTLNNITNLMIQSVNEDKLALKTRVEQALKILISQNLVRQNIQNYVFQTDEEQEVTRLIESMDFNPTEGKHKLAVDILDAKIDSNQFSYKNENAIGKAFDKRYNFMYNFYIDDYAYRKNSNPNLEVKIITPYNEGLWNNHDQLIIQSTKNQLLINLPLDLEFMRHISTYIKVEKYITTATASSAIKNFAQVKAEKANENQELNDTINYQLDDFLKAATFYFNNTQLQVSGNDFRSKLLDALQQMAKLVYHKNDLVDSAINEDEIKRLLKGSDDLDITAESTNRNVVDDVKRYMQLHGPDKTITMKTLRDNYIGKVPYGFINEDLEWAIAYLFKKNDIDLIKNGVPIITADFSESTKAIFERRNPEKIIVRIRKKASDTQKKLVAELGYELFENKNIVDDNNDNNTMDKFIGLSEKMISDFLKFNSTGTINYPQSDDISKGIGILNQIVNVKDTSSFFEILKNKKDDLLDWAEDSKDIRNFHTSNQKAIWDKANEFIGRIETSKLKQSTEKLNQIILQMKNIMKKVRPYKEIPQLSTLNNEFKEEYSNFIENKADIAKVKVAENRQIVLADLSTRPFKEDFSSDINRKFDKINSDIDSYKMVDDIELAVINSNNLVNDFQRQFTKIENEERKKNLEDMQKATLSKTEDDIVGYEKKTKEVIDVSLKDLVGNYSLIRTNADVEIFVDALKQELLNKLDNNHEIRIHIK